MIKKIEDYQLRELQEEKLYINIYDLSIKYDYELTSCWKEFFFDILESLTKNYYEFHIDFLAGKSLFNYMKNNYKIIIKEYKLNIDIRDYVDINDYVSYQEWSKNPDNGIAFFGKDVYLVKKTTDNNI